MNKPKGRPPLEPRIATLEHDRNVIVNAANDAVNRIATLEGVMESHAHEMIKLTQALNEAWVRLEALELRFKDYRVAQSKNAQQLESMVYKPQFEHWPNQSER